MSKHASQQTTAAAPEQAVPGRWAIWMMAVRPKTLTAAVAPVVMGTALAYGDGLHHWGAALVALFCAILIQIGTNFANDYYDYVQGADTGE
ncbi:MAG: 1,4-dihydroxy-2-naphthoate polyprenyltransferase, partial [Calditrichaeota bacterium]